LARKNIVPQLNKTTQELLDEHVRGRKPTASLVDAKGKHLQGDSSKRSQIIFIARELGNFHPRHIEKEDKHLFHSCQDYFMLEEQEKLLAEFWEFDRRMIHEKYKRIFEACSQLSSSI